MKVVGDTSKSRIIAAFIDNLFAFAATMIVVSLVPETFPAVKAVCFFLVYLAYFIVLEALWSRTFGKFFQGLVVRKVDGSRAAWKESLIRGGLRILEVNPLLFGGLPAGIAIISSDRKQRIGDMLANTVVVSNELRWDETESREAEAEGRTL